MAACVTHRASRGQMMRYDAQSPEVRAALQCAVHNHRLRLNERLTVRQVKLRDTGIMSRDKPSHRRRK